MLIGEDDVKKPIAYNPLEQFVLLSKGTKGAASLDLIKTVLEAPGVYVFAELLSQPNIREVNIQQYNSFDEDRFNNNLFVCSLQLENTPHTNYLNTLNLFAYGTYKQYLEQKSSLIELSDIMKKKLKHLTIVTMAIKDKCIAYSDLLDQLDIGCVRELEDLIIESIYAGLTFEISFVHIFASLLLLL